ncbi:MAG: hypothetical protein ACYDER_26540 [Ktedonobacteraceae bacterium]
MCLKRLFQLVFFGIAAVVVVIMFAPSLIRGAGNALLSSVNNSAAQGFSSLVPDAQGKGLTLQINVSNLNPNSDYFVTLDRDECGGQVLANAGKITTDGSGATTANLSVGDLTGLLQNTLYLDVHQGADANGQSVACGQVQINGAVASLIGSPTTTSTTSTTTSSNSTITSSSVGDSPGSGFLLHHSPFGGFPNTGVAPDSGNGYDNNSFPRKY